ncbi:MAG: hypothetical protein F6K08_30050 [Okeania sp. SIO1H6]|nr:hypothetical protein [Okeania sp. SIO1H6]
MFNSPKEEITKEDIDFLKKCHQRELEKNEKKYTDWQLELAFVIGLFCGSLIIATSIGTLQLVQYSKKNHQIEQNDRIN